MNEPLPEPLMTWRLIRVNAVRIVIGTALMTVAYWAIGVYSTHEREQRVARKIEAIGGEVNLAYLGPNWLPQFVRKRFPVWEHIIFVNLDGNSLPSNDVIELGALTNLRRLHLENTNITDNGLEHLKERTSLVELNLDDTNITDNGLEHLKQSRRFEKLHLDGTQVTDVGLKHLKGLTNLDWLLLNGTKVSDVGLQHLQGLKSLQHLYLDDTDTTPKGRAILREALPNCKITPDP